IAVSYCIFDSSEDLYWNSPALKWLSKNAHIKVADVAGIDSRVCAVIDGAIDLERLAEFHLESVAHFIGIRKCCISTMSGLFRLK
ncbi:MAG: hypothetical protein ABIP37_07630, partial [Methylotenera sp.]